MLYSARARTKTPAAPATPIATPPVGAGAPPVDFEDEAEADAELEPELEPEPELEAVAEEETGKVVWAAFEAVWLVTITLEPVSDTVSWVVAGTPTIWASKFEVAHALTLLGRSLNQAGKVPAAAALTTEERKVGFVIISFCHEYGMAVSMTVNTELGISAIKAAAEAEAAESASELVSEPIDSAVAVVSGAGVASAEAAKRRAAKNLYMVIVHNKARDRSEQKKELGLTKKKKKGESTNS